MLKSGAEHLESLRDGRVVYIGGERVRDVTRHPAFAAAARTVAALYDMKRDPANREALSFDDGGERFSMYFLLPRTRDDLVRRMRAHKAIADATYGLFGRSPDHVASFVVGLAMQPHELQAGVADRRLYQDNLLSYYREERARDHYTAYAVVPAPGTRDPEFFGRAGYQSPTLRVTKEDD
ncbi:MAG: 4-hydroxyphenylacetate 3-hydroxylase N-terminal domain-containing protein, partial [Alphaproteobacteria bacterium]